MNFTQFFLQRLKFGVVEGQYTLAPASAIWLFMASAILEFPTMYEKKAFDVLIDNLPTFVIATLMVYMYVYSIYAYTYVY